jgi:molecular chaperone DnaK (HSP70)
MSDTELAIGIDLGTTYSCVAFYKNERVEVIENKTSGLKTTPSIVTFSNEDRIIGRPPKISANCVFEVKRLIGRRFDDETVQNDLKNWPFQVINDKSKPLIQVQFEGKQRLFHPEEISAMILGKMKEIASLHLNQEIKKAVITVPAYFNDAQRQSTKDAAAIAGLEVLRIINEPSAAAIAYGYDKRIYEKKNILIYDLGGGTFDVSIMQVNDGKFQVLAIGGDTHLGGVDFDNRLVEHFIKVFSEKYDIKIDRNNDKKSIQKLRSQCELAKRSLSDAVEATIEIDNFLDNQDINETISRALFEDLCEDLFLKTIDVVKSVLEDAKLEKNDISDIVLIGGSIRIPKIQTLLEDFFDGKQTKQNINPDEAVACGAAIQAAILCNGNPELDGVKILDVTPLSLGIETNGGVFSSIIKRNTNIPITKSRNYTTVTDDQETIRIKVFEGERSLVQDNNLLGQFTLNDIKKAPAGEPRIEVTFSIDSDGILLVKAKDMDNFSMNEIVITNTKDHLTQDQISKMIADADKWNQHDKEQLKKIEAKNRVETLCYQKKGEIRNKQSLNLFKRQKLEDEIGKVSTELKNYKQMSIHEINKLAEILDKLEIY